MTEEAKAWWHSLWMVVVILVGWAAMAWAVWLAAVERNVAEGAWWLATAALCQVQTKVAKRPPDE